MCKAVADSPFVVENLGRRVKKNGAEILWKGEEVGFISQAMCDFTTDMPPDI